MGWSDDEAWHGDAGGDNTGTSCGAGHAGTASTMNGAQAVGNRARLPFGHKLGGGFGQMLDGIATQSLNLFLLFYATAVCGLPGALAGLALATGLVVDAIVDPLIGSLSDNHRSRWGRRLPFMAVGLPATCVMLVVIFSVPPGLSTTATFLWFAGSAILIRIAISLWMLPFQATIAELSQDYAERSSIVSWRWMLAVTGTIATIVLGFGIFFAGAGGTTNRAAYTPFATTLVGIVLVAGLIAMRAIHRSMPARQPPVAPPGGSYLRVFSELAEVFRNPSFRVLFLDALMFFSALGSYQALGLHVNTYFWKLEPAQIQLVTLSVFVGLLIGAPLSAPLVGRVEKRTLLMVGIAGLAAANCLPATLRLLGAWPFEGNALVVSLVAMFVVGGILMSAAAIAFGSMMADATDEHEHMFGTRREGMYFAGWAFASKASSGVGALTAGIVLQIVHFPAIAAGHGAAASHAEVSAATLHGLALFYGPGIGALFVGASLFISLYKLDARRHATIVGELRERHAALAGAEAMLAP